MNRQDEKFNNEHMDRECRLHGRCGRDIPLLTLMEITVFGLDVLKKDKNTTKCRSCSS